MNEFSIIGFGNQAQAWALNLKDSGVEVHIGLRENSPSIKKVMTLGFKVFFLNQVIPTSSFSLLIPDDQHETTLKELSEYNKEKTCIYAHGYSLAKFELQNKFPTFQHVLLAPKSIASELRFLYETKGNLTGFYSLQFAMGFSLDQLSDLARKLGLTNIYETSFIEETQADLFSEQSILCSLIPYGILETYNTLIKKGYSKELSFYECFYESKLILDTIFKVGPQAFFNLISPNALIGSEVGRKLLIDEDFKEKLSTLLENIEQDKFQETINNTDISQLKNQVANYWQEQALSSTYDELKETL
ncbi:MAG: ketol-acid reductoisomerase [Bacteriovoracaceae bacterium]|jgi:ketol-acid reductoisomerase